MLAPLLIALLAKAPPAPVSGDAAAAQAMLRRLEERSAHTSDLVARFSQSYRSGMLGRQLTEHGTVEIKRPGLMRWEYTDPEKKLFVSDGRTFYFYVPAEKQVIVSQQDQQRSLAARLLSGRGDLGQEFTVSLDSPQEEGLVRLELVPRQEDADLQRAWVDLEPSGRIRAIQLDDVQGNRTSFRFEAIRENTGLKDQRFRFEVPKGVEVIRG